VMTDEAVIGAITSGDWGHRVQKNIAYAFVDIGYESVGTEFEIDMCGEMVRATVIDPIQYDPEYALVR